MNSKSRTRDNTYLLLLLSLAIYVAGCASEEERWTEAQSVNTIPAYTEFINRYPGGPFTARARTSLNALYLEELAEAIMSGDVTKVRSLIDAGVDVTAQGKFGAGKYALPYAVWAGNAQIVQALVEAGADVNWRNEDGDTLLMHAQTAKIVQALLDVGADVNAKTNDGTTALILFGTLGQDIQILKMLLEAGADINAQTELGMTSLMYAAWMGKTSIVQALLEAGADIYLTTFGPPWDTALDLARNGGHAEIVELLQQANP